MYNISSEGAGVKLQQDKEKIIESLSALLSSTAQTNLFFFDNITELCASYLEKCGYVVIKPRLDLLIYTIPKLVEVFYDLLSIKRKKLYPPNKARDNHLAKFFVESVMEEYRCSQEAAIKICASIIKTVITYENYFNFKEPISDFSVFTKSNLYWLSKKAFDIMDDPSYYTEDPTVEYNEGWEEFVKDYIDRNGEESLSFDL